MTGLTSMTDLTSMTADERHRILDDYLDAVFGYHESPVAERLRTGEPELPDDPTADQVAAWVELVELLRDPAYIESSRRMAERAHRRVTHQVHGHRLDVATVGVRGVLDRETVHQILDDADRFLAHLVE